MVAKVIETRYGGRRFRSRTEARWAVFFDTLKIEFDYELEGWEFPTGRYLPDFFIPSIDAWIEIKGRPIPTETELSLAKSLCVSQNKNVFIFCGQPRIIEGYSLGIPEAIKVFPERDIPHEAGVDDGYSWCFCPDCGKFGITFRGLSDRLICKDVCPKRSTSGSGWPTAFDDRMMQAYQQAASARFEFGGQ